MESTLGITSPNGLNMSNIASFTETIGIIYPPPDIRGIIDKTAQFVAKNGPEFEQRVLEEKGNAQKFSFLLTNNAYRPYYDAKVREFQTGEVNEATQPRIPKAIIEIKKEEAEKKQKKEHLLSLTSYSTDILPNSFNSLVTLRGSGVVSLPNDNRNLVNSSATKEESPPEPPPEDQYTTIKPYASPLDIEIIKLTAQYVARNGQKFLIGLGHREKGNPQFSFLRPAHPLFPYFTSLVDAYTRCLLPDKAALSRLKEDVGLAGRFSSRKSDETEAFVTPTDMIGTPRPLPERQINAMRGILERVEARHKWESYDEKQREERAKREAEERQQIHAMDWHEFTVVEVINFTEDDDSLPLGSPIDQKSLIPAKVLPPLALSSALPSISMDPSLAKDLQDVRELDIKIQDTVFNDNKRGSADFSLDNQNPEDSAMLSPNMKNAPSTQMDSNAVHPLPLTPNIAGLDLSRAPAVMPLLDMGSLTPSLVNLSQPTTSQQGGFSYGPPEPTVPSVSTIVVVKDYVRQPKKRSRENYEMLKCPITGQLVPSDQMSEHLRILLLDTKWKEQREILLAKAQKESAFAPHSDFEKNLANFVLKRPDLFGTIEDECESSYLPAPKRK